MTTSKQTIGDIMIYIKQTAYMIADELLQDEWANWSYDGAHALAEYLEELAEDMDIELDIVAIRCEFNEYSNLEELKNCYHDTPIHEILEYVVARGDGFVIAREF